MAHGRFIAMDTVIAQLSSFVDGLHPLVSFLAVAGIGFVPFLESYVGAFVGVLAGLPIAVALPAAIIGNLVALWIAVRLGGATARGVAKKRGPRSDRQEKIIARVDRWGVPVASLLAPTVMAISITAYVMVAAGLDRRAVVIWQVVAVVLWGVVLTIPGLLLVNAVS